jgi:bifunctional ADP-heptose synthase (sugar kinase/adenylyltransferase)
MSNIFVIGDLIIDHSVFVRELPPSQRTRNITSFRVLRRMDTAGGAAHSARILAALNQGHTFLWGLMGESHWGSFRQILENCHRIDGAQASVEFRGARDETRAQMNTITRLIRAENTPSYDQLIEAIQFDDYGHVHVSEDKRRAVRHYLERAHAKSGLHGIVIIDYDMNCLTKETINEIADFARTAKLQEDTPIPLFIDPKGKREKYEDIQGEAIMPNLSEWCALVEQPQAEGEWQLKLNNRSGLEEMAQRSFRFLGNFRYHIIKCGELGAVILAPHPKENHKYAVYRVAPHSVQKSARPFQLGLGDVMTASFALEFAESDQKTTQDALIAFQKANAVTACYRDMPWQHMPSVEAVAEAQKKMVKPILKAEPMVGMFFLPKEKFVNMSKHETDTPGLFSLDTNFQQRMKALLEDIRDNWDKNTLKSLILGAPPGCGKSTIMSQLEKGDLGKRFGITALDLSHPKKIQWKNMNAFFKGLAKSKGGATGKVLVIVDEALKRTDDTMGAKLKTYGVPMLNYAHEYNIRFLFIDAAFKPSQPSSVKSEFEGRCNPHYLPGLVERPKDIPYIIAGRLLDNAGKNGLTSIKIKGDFLLSVTNAALDNKSDPRRLCTWVDYAYKKAFSTRISDEPLMLQFEHLPRNRTWEKKFAAMVPEEFEFRKS